MHFTGQEVTTMYDELMMRLDSLQPGDKDTQLVLDSLKELHGTSAGLKAFCTWGALNIIDQCRQALGGHGYSAYAGLAGLYADWAVQCTWEGDNNILTLQAGRYLIGCYKESKQGIKQAPGVSYLNNIEKYLKGRCMAKTIGEICDLNMMSEAFSSVSANVVKKAGEDFQEYTKKGMKEEEAYEECSSARLFAAKIHSYGYLFQRFKDGIAKSPLALQPVLKVD